MIYHLSHDLPSVSHLMIYHLSLSFSFSPETHDDIFTSYTILSIRWDEIRWLIVWWDGGWWRDEMVDCEMRWNIPSHDLPSHLSSSLTFDVIYDLSQSTCHLPSHSCIFQPTSLSSWHGKLWEMVKKVNSLSLSISVSQSTIITQIVDGRIERWSC